MKKLFIALCATSFLVTAQAQPGSVRYVTPTGGLHPLGSSWYLASNDLQAMIDDAFLQGGGEIWVKQGVYTPNNPPNGLNFGPHNGGGVEQNSFIMRDGVEVYGGFAGWETQVDQRDWKANTTILSGNMANIGMPGMRCFHVVIFAGVSNAVLNGFTIEGGLANRWQCCPSPSQDPCYPQMWMLVNGIMVPDCLGGGINVTDASNFTLKNLIIRNNEARKGGGIYMSDASGEVQNVILHDNISYEGGGGIAMEVFSTPRLINVLVHHNKAIQVTDPCDPANLFQNRGGGIYIEASYPEFTNVTVADNWAATYGNDVYNTGSSVILNNSIIDNDFAIDATNANVVLFPYHLTSNYSMISNINFYSTALYDVYLDIELNDSRIGSINAYPASSGNILYNVVNNNTLIGVPTAPYFRGNSANPNYRLLPFSPCIDAGDINLFPLPPHLQMDLDGNHRLAGADVDMGAYEHGSPPLPPNIVNQKSANENKKEESYLESTGEGFNLYVYPNPTNDGNLTTIYLGEGYKVYEKPVEVKIYSMDGRLLYAQTFPYGKIQTHFSDLSSGIYVLKVQTQEGVTYKQKLLINK